MPHNSTQYTSLSNKQSMVHLEQRRVALEGKYVHVLQGRGRL